MALKLNEKQVALTLGLFAAVVHAAWAAIVATGSGQSIVNWLYGLHFISSGHTVGAFNGIAAVMLVVVTFICGAVLGWLFAKIWNWLPKQKWYRQL